MRKLSLAWHWKVFLAAWSLALGIVLLLLTNSREVRQETGPFLGSVSSQTGTAKIKRQGEVSWRNCRLGDKILEGDYLSTGPDSQVEVEFVGGEYIAIGSDSILKLTRPSPFLSDIEVALLDGRMSSPPSAFTRVKEQVSQAPGQSAQAASSQHKSELESGGHLVLKTEDGIFRLREWKNLEIRRERVQGSLVTNLVRLVPQVEGETKPSPAEDMSKLQLADSKPLQEPEKALPQISPEGGRFVIFSSKAASELTFPFQLMGTNATQTRGWIPLTRVYAFRKSWIIDDGASSKNGLWNLDFSKFITNPSKQSDYIDLALQPGATQFAELSSKFESRFSQDLSFFKFKIIADEERILFNLEDLKYLRPPESLSWLSVSSPGKISYRLSLTAKADRSHLIGFMLGAKNQVSFENWTSLPNEAYFLVRKGSIIGFLEANRLTQEDINLLVRELKLDLIFLGSPQLFMGKFRLLNLDLLKKSNTSIFLLNRGVLVKLSRDLLYSNLSTKNLLDQTDQYAFSEAVTILFSADPKD